MLNQRFPAQVDPEVKRVLLDLSGVRDFDPAVGLVRNLMATMAYRYLDAARLGVPKYYCKIESSVELEPFALKAVVEYYLLSQKRFVFPSAKELELYFSSLKRPLHPLFRVSVSVRPTLLSIGGQELTSIHWPEWGVEPIVYQVSFPVMVTQSRDERFIEWRSQDLCSQISQILFNNRAYRKIESGEGQRVRSSQPIDGSVSELSQSNRFIPTVPDSSGPDGRHPVQSQRSSRTRSRGLDEREGSDRRRSAPKARLDDY